MIILIKYPDSNVPMCWINTNDENYKIPEGSIIMKSEEERKEYEELHRKEIESFVPPEEIGVGVLETRN